MLVELVECEGVFAIIEVEFADLYDRELILEENKKKTVCYEGSTLTLIQSARTFASAHLFVLGGKIVVEPNICISIVIAS